MYRFLISLDELDRVKRSQGIRNISHLSEITGITRPTWTKAIKQRVPTEKVLNALANLGARPDKLLVRVDAELNDCAA